LTDNSTTVAANNGSSVEPVNIETEMRTSYLDYAMSVIVSRAIPDVRDGLKPVHRRIIFAMNESSCYYNRPYRKSARIVGEVMGKYHPHGDSAIYDSLVRMAQPFSLRVPLVDGQGNFGSMDGDNAAAMRYTESRMAKVAHHLVNDIDKDTVDWKENYDGSEKEPTVLPAEFPNMLVNGAGGIAVGMATNIPPHNLGESIDACCLLMDNPETTIDEIIEVMPAPDFPTGSIILGRAGATSAMHTGRGSVIMRGRATIEERPGGKEAIIITEIPYQVNKALMVEKIAHMVRDKKIEGISDLRDESDKQGVRVVVETKRDAMASVVLSQLYKYTPLQTSFASNMLALNNGRPQLMNVKIILQAFIDFREEVVARRTNFLLNKSRDRAHILIGQAMAVANIDEVIKVIRSSPDPVTAKEELMRRDWNAANVQALIDLVDDDHTEVMNGKCKFTEIQAKGILEMRLSKLTGLEQGKIDEELAGLATDISRFLEILASREILMGIVREELLEIKENFATPRKSIIEASEFEEDIEDLIMREDMVVTVTVGGYIKRVPLATYRAQKRGGKGRSGMSTKEEDVVSQVFVANTHTPMLFFSTAGKAYKLKAYQLPLGSPTSQGRSLMNIFPLETGETINVIMPLPEDEDAWENMNIVFATASGGIRRNSLGDFESVRANGKIAMKLDEGDELIGVAVADPSQHIMLAAKSGKALRCPVDAVRVFKGRNSTGVRGIALAEDDKVISMTILDGADKDTEIRDQFLRIPVEKRRVIARLEEANDLADVLEGVDTELDYETIHVWAKSEEFILTITENGYGKRSSAYEYRSTNRGGKGIVNIVTSDRNGDVIASFPVLEEDQIMLITNAGKLIRTPIVDVRIAGRNTQGVTLFKVGKGETIMSAAHIKGGDEDDEEELAEGEEGEVLTSEGGTEASAEPIANSVPDEAAE
jgi:DNA gyrase subunit A